MRQSLHTATVTGTVTTTKGVVSFRVWTSATSPVSVLEINATAGEAVEVTLKPVRAVARVNPALVAPAFDNPPAECSSPGSGSGRQTVCTQVLACDRSGASSFSTALLRTTASTTGTAGTGATDGAQSGAGRAGGTHHLYLVSVGNSQPSSGMYPETTRHNPAQEAVDNVEAAASNPALYQEHLEWWAQYYDLYLGAASQGSSFVTVPDTRLEGFYHIQQSKLGSATRRHGTPILDQTGPFRADLAIKCSREPQGINGTGWPFQMYDWNVEESYFGCVRASDSHLDLSRAPYALYGVKYIDLVSLW